MRLIFGPSKVLKQKSKPFSKEEFGNDMVALSQSMLKIMRGFGGVGLAGIQLGLPKRILVGEANGKEFVLINPEVKDASKEKVSFNEGCLSFPMESFNVDRPSDITVSYQNADGTHVEEKFSGLASRIIQHEMDHLNGITILDKVSHLKRSLYIKKMKKRLKKYNRAKKKLESLDVT
tara:strand:+ start:14225 stop:14755 length:531 start_codon:yes stop_codon:yes gene_type:complete